MNAPPLVSHFSSQGIGNLIYSIIFNRAIAKRLKLDNNTNIYFETTGAIGPTQGDDLDLSYFDEIFDYLGVECKHIRFYPFSIYSSNIVRYLMNILHPRIKYFIENYIPQSLLFNSNSIVETKPFGCPDETRIFNLNLDKPVFLRGNFINTQIHENLKYGFVEFSEDCVFTERRIRLIKLLDEKGILFTKNSIHVHIRGGDYLTPKNRCLYLPPTAIYYRDALCNLIDNYNLTDANIYIHSNDLVYAKSVISQLRSSFGPSFDFTYLDLHPLESFECFRQALFAVATNSTFSYTAMAMNERLISGLIPRYWYKDISSKAFQTTNIRILNDL